MFASNNLMVLAAAVLATEYMTLAGGSRPPPPPGGDGGDGSRPPPPPPDGDDGGRDDGRDGGDRDGGDGGPRPPPPRPDPSPEEPGYFATNGYIQQPATVKQAELWQQCQTDQSVAPADQVFDVVRLFESDMGTTFGRIFDEMPQGRVKFNHRQGVVGTVAWQDLGNHPYTGLYQGSDLGLIRFSEGNFLLPETPGLTPTMALKFQRDGIASVNFTANVDFEPIVGSWNFFENDFKTRIPLFQDPLNKETIERKFLERTRHVGSTGLAEFARLTQNAEEVLDFQFPFDLWFRPNPELAALWEDSTSESLWYEQLTDDVQIGDVLYEIWAQNEPESFNDSTETHIGNIIATSELIMSTFGDERLFFKHESMRLDHDRHPEWRQFVEQVPGNVQPWRDTPIPAGFPTDPEEQRAFVRGQLATHGCPFAWLLGLESEPIFDQA